MITKKFRTSDSYHEGFRKEKLTVYRRSEFYSISGLLSYCETKVMTGIYTQFLKNVSEKEVLILVSNTKSTDKTQ